MRDWDDAFDNMGHVAGSAMLPSLWSQRAERYRQTLDAFEAGIPYGEGERQRFDLVRPDGAPKGLVVFVHGGYWMRLDRSFWTDLAEGARARGWAVALPSYSLAPAARIFEITAEIGMAVSAAAALVDGPIRLVGHSAGGHLVTRMISADAPLPGGLRERVALTLSISGLHDLRPLLKTRMNATLRLTPEEAAAESPVLGRPAGRTRLVCWVGGDERPEFIRQAQLMATMWEGLDVPVRCAVEQGMNHFTVVDGLKDPSSPITRALLSED